MLDPLSIRKAFAPQIVLSKTECGRLENRIRDDYAAAQSDHSARMQRFQQYYMRFRNRTEAAALGEEAASNVRVPLTQWQVYSKWAKEMSSLFGADAQVIAQPVGPSDQKVVKKAGIFQSWRLFNSMRIQKPAGVFGFRKVLFGRAHAYAPWKRDTYRVPLEAGGWDDEVYYEGPGFDPLWPDDFIVPAEDAKTLHDFSFNIRKYRATPDDLLRGERAGLYQGIEKNFQDIVHFAGNHRGRDDGDQVKREKDWSEGVIYEGSLSAGESLVVHEWYGRWRRLSSRRDASEHNLRGRDLEESELVVRFLPEMNMTVGVQDLSWMYPRLDKRRPIVESALVNDGSYWGPGFGELLEMMETELSVAHNLGTEAGEMSVGPLIFFNPASGFDPDTFVYSPKTAIPTQDPAGVRVVQVEANQEYPIRSSQTLIGYAERVTGITDQNLGRSEDKPNAPRTARQTLALLEEGDVRASLDTNMLREDWGAILKHFWALEGMYGADKTFFRVTEEDADGLFDRKGGGAYMTSDELSGAYDFDLKFATNAWSRETQKQNQLSLYQLDLQNPLVVQNPRALWVLIDKVHRAFGDDNFRDIIPEPPDPGTPKNPRDEWTLMLEGEEVHVNPLDNDQLHLMDHNKRLDDAREDPERDQDAFNSMARHTLEHIEQMQQKKLMAELAGRLSDSLANNTPESGGLLSGAPSASLAELHGGIGDLIAGQQNPNAPPPTAPKQPKPGGLPQ